MTAMYQEGEGNQPCLVQIRESEERLFGHFPVSEYLMCQNILRRFRLLMECFGVVRVRNAWKTAKKKKGKKKVTPGNTQNFQERKKSLAHNKGKH